MRRARLPPKNVRAAIRSGPVPKMRAIEDVIEDPRPASMGELVCAFAGRYLIVPEGMKIGEPLILDPYQQAFIMAVFDNPAHTREAYLSIAARNGKTALVAVILLAFLIGPLARKNTVIASGAMSKEQAGLCFQLMHNILLMSPEVAGKWDAVPSSKKLFGLVENTEYRSLSAEAKTGYGASLYVILLDEAGLVRGPTSEFVKMLDSRQGSFEDALRITISTQAPSDMDYLSVLLDTAERTQDPHIVSHVYAAEPGCDLMDTRGWEQANPGLGKFRSRADLEKNMRAAMAIPANESSARNQFLNQRVAMEALAFPPNVWKACAGAIDMEVFRRGPTYMGLDLSSKNDLTAAVLCAEDDDGIIHVLPYVFCPTNNIEQRARRDRAPYDLWCRQGDMIPIGGNTMDFDQIAEALNDELSREGIQVAEIHYDKHMITHFQAAADRCGAFAGTVWVGVPQFFKDMGARLASLSGLMAESRMRHGGHPVLAMSASVAVAKVGREGVSALAKNLSTQRIDPVVALVMAAWPFGDGREGHQEFDAAAWIG